MSGRSGRLAPRLVILAGAPAVAVAMAALWTPWPLVHLRWPLTIAIAAVWIAGAMAVKSRLDFDLRTVSNLLAALREGDYSFRARGGSRSDAFGEVVLELNLLAESLRSRRHGEVETAALLGKVLGEIEAAVIAFDADNRLRLANPAARRLLDLAPDAGDGIPATELGLVDCLEGPPSRTARLDLAGGSGRFELRRGTFRQHGRPYRLLILLDVGATLRAEELEAWRRLIRVIGHELNNSLAPITSLADSLEKLAATDPPPEDWRDDLRSGLHVIGDRAGALNRFMGAYAQLARMPAPQPRPMSVRSWVERVTSLEHRHRIVVAAGPDLEIEGDADQLDQLLINLVKNAIDAVAGRDGEVRVSWCIDTPWLELKVEDDGPGLPPSANLFVPFFTTKAGGSGVGLVLARQVAEAHLGSVELGNRHEGSGCVVTVRLPLCRLS